MKRSLQLLALIVVLCAGFAAKAQAQDCSCDRNPLPHLEAIKDAVETNFGTYAALKLEIETEIQIVKAYPSFAEKMNVGKFKGTACEDTGPQGESLNHCARSAKADYTVKLQKGTCEAVIQVKSSYISASAKLISSDC